MYSSVSATSILRPSESAADQDMKVIVTGPALVAGLAAGAAVAAAGAGVAAPAAAGAGAAAAAGLVGSVAAAAAGLVGSVAAAGFAPAGSAGFAAGAVVGVAAYWAPVQAASSADEAAPRPTRTRRRVRTRMLLDTTFLLTLSRRLQMQAPDLRRQLLVPLLGPGLERHVVPVL